MWCVRRKNKFICKRENVIVRKRQKTTDCYFIIRIRHQRTQLFTGTSKRSQNVNNGTFTIENKLTRSINHWFLKRVLTSSTN